MREATTTPKMDYFRMPRPLWRKLKKYLPNRRKRKSAKGGRPRASERAVADAKGQKQGKHSKGAANMVKGVANVWVPVEDVERALNFYQNILGFSVIKQDGPWAEVDANGLNIGLNGREPERVQAGGGPVVTFQPEASLEAVIEDLEGKGVEFAAGISEHEWGRVATFKDSEGNDLQLYEPPSG